ncbi:cytochrome c-type biogenesis protein [Candidatus Endowatersipora endosymbiont of Watersipora subatra]|uniref:cytochrome c-type biogenesis protein n=1 Tax=Candidatus Endowatersipora endosymbiont of Watersipora subatra TaxID=3077946 RepID=UPI00312CAA4C
MIQKILIFLLLLGVRPIPFAWGKRVDTVISETNEIRAHLLFKQLRCVVCQNQSLYDSHAEIAVDLRNLVRKQIQYGKSNKQILSFLVSRYGEFILLKPVFGLHTMILWSSPFGVLVLGSICTWYYWFKKSDHTTPELSHEEERTVNKILDKLD